MAKMAEAKLGLEVQDDDIVASYLLILGRHPETSEARRRWSGTKLTDLWAIFLSSSEFSEIAKSTVNTSVLPHAKNLDNEDFRLAADWLARVFDVAVPDDSNRWWLLVASCMHIEGNRKLIERRGAGEFLAFVARRAIDEQIFHERLMPFVAFDRDWFAKANPSGAVAALDPDNADQVVLAVQAAVQRDQQVFPFFSQGLEPFRRTLRDKPIESLAQLSLLALRGAQTGVLSHWLFDRPFFQGLVGKMRHQSEDASKLFKSNRLSYLDFLLEGDHADISPHPLFSHYTYRAAGDFGDGGLAGGCFRHYVLRGSMQGRSTSIVFDERFYLAMNPHIVSDLNSGLYTCALHHFCLVGIYHDLAFCPDFDIAYYRQQNPDISAELAAGKHPSATWHFVFKGLLEGRAPNRFFNPRYYRERQPIVAAEMAQHGLLSELEHFLLIGKSRGYKAESPQVSAQAPLEEAKAVFLRRARRSLNNVLMRPPDFSPFTTSQSPAISIVVPVCGEPEFTSRFLECAYFAAIHLDRVSGKRCEIVIVDNGSNGALDQLLSCRGLLVTTFPEPIGFPRAVNEGVARSSGRLIVVCNNDIEFDPDVLSRVLETMNADATIGVLGGQTLLPNETLQEAGSYLDNRGGVAGLGRGEDPWNPYFQSRSEPDYCTGSFIAFHRADFDELGGFDEGFSPGYYEETDFMLRLKRHCGKRVILCPSIQIRHFEHASFGKGRPPTASYAKIAQNRLRFAQKHSDILIAKPSGRALVTRDGRIRPGSVNRRRFLIIEDLIPDSRLGSGFGRTQQLARALIRHGVGFDLLVLNPSSVVDDFEDPRVTVYRGWMKGEAPDTIIARNAHHYTHIIVCRTHNLIRLGRLLETARVQDGVQIICDTEALASLRVKEMRAIAGVPQSAAETEAALRSELDSPARIAHWIAVSAYEQHKMEEIGIAPVSTLGYPLKARKMDQAPGFAKRHRLLVVGPVHEVGTPNHDGINWLLSDIWPRVAARLEGLTLTCVGYWEPRALAAFHRRWGDLGIDFTGPVASGELDRLYDEARIALAPTRFAGGVPIKVIEGMSHGVPMVITDLLERQLFGIGEIGHSGLAVAPRDDGGAAFAALIEKLGSDEVTWTGIQRTQFEAIRAIADENAFDASVDAIFCRGMLKTRE